MSAAPQPVLLPTPRCLNISSGFVGSAALLSRIDPAAAPAQGYRLRIEQDQILLVGADAAGLFYGQKTLLQLRRQYPFELPCLDIHDWPDFPVRGVMLDVSRDKVPTVSTLCALIDRLAEWKINHLQLYIEHTFAYRGHEEVWKDASPLTADEIRTLDAYCAARHVELVPNQNSFGHMERWLKHPRYLPLAEAPNGAETPWGYRWKGPFSLCPTNPACIDLLKDLYDQLLPNFSSRLFSVGCDETFDIGQGRSKLECDRRGVHVLYLDFLKKVGELVSARGRRMMFWGDIILKDPESISQIPRGAVALNWGYEADHPFDAEAAVLASAGIDFHVCPGTSSWCSISGRTDNMLANQKSAAIAGRRHGAAGFLNTDWGDFGHLQYLPISYAGLAAGAAASWCFEANSLTDLDRALDLHAFFDSAGIMGRLALDLGNVYKFVGKLIPNRSALFNILVSSSARSDPLAGIAAANIEAAQGAIRDAMRLISNARMPSGEGALVSDEFAGAAAMLQHACERALWKLAPSSVKNDDLTESLQAIISVHRRLWLARNRSGGLEDSVARLSGIFAENRPDRSAIDRTPPP